jgi:twinkle protein
LALWNHDCLLDSSDRPVVICEGEWDAMVALSLGWRAVSVPNGAPAQETEDVANAKRYEYLWRSRELLNRVKHFILATDDDEPGRALRADLVALLGAERCSFIEYPFPSKDLNEVLLDQGAEGVSTALNSAKPYPVKGIYGIDDFPEKAAVIEYPIGIDPLRDMIAIVPGTLTVFTGYANMGKSTVMNSIIANLLRLNIPTCIASFETEVKPILRDGLRACIMGCAQSDLSNKSTADADELLRDNLSIITQMVDEDDEMDLDFFLDLCRTSVVRDGTKVIILDPWNELEHKRRRDETETDYISRALRSIKKFAKQHDVAFWIVAHPTKPQDGRVKMPKLYDISGSANWANKADYGLSYHRADPAQNLADFCVSKVRMGLPGRKGTVSATFDFRNSQFREVAR